MKNIILTALWKVFPRVMNELTYGFSREARYTLVLISSMLLLGLSVFIIKLIIVV